MPLLWCLCLLALQGAAATLYIKLRFDGSKAAPVMHAAVVIALLVTCLLPFLAGVTAAPSRRRRLAFTAVMTVAQVLLWLFHGLMLLAYTHWQSAFALELLGAYAPHVPTLLRASGVAPSLAAALASLVVAATALAYWRISDAALRGLADLVHLAGRGAARIGARRVAAALAGMSVVAAAVYVPTRSLWATREPVHIALNSDWSQGQLAPVPLFVNYSVGRREVMPSVVSTAPRPRTLVLVIVDALRSDRMRVYGAARENTPFLSSLAREGTLHRVDRAYSVCTVSFCGILGTLASRYWHQLSVPPATITDVLASYGYHSRFVLGGDHRRFSILTNLYGSHVDAYTDGADLGGAYPNDDRALIASLRRSRPPDGAPLFLYVHLMSVHALGTRHDDYRRWQPDTVSLLEGWRDPARRATAYRNRYDNGILQADAMIREVFDWLRESRRLDDALVVLTADHGESLGEDGHFAHGGAPVEAMVRIPLLIYDAQQGTYPSRAVSSQVDIAPTMLASIGVTPPSSFAGVPLQQSVSGRPIHVDSHQVSGVVLEQGGRLLKHLVRVEDGAEWLVGVDEASSDSESAIRGEMAGPPLRKRRADLRRWHVPRP